MAKPKFHKRPPPNYGPGWHLLKTAAKALLALALAFGVLVGIAWFGSKAGTEVAPLGRYTVAFADIETAAPPGRERIDFLNEVRYLGDLPETVQSVDPKLAQTLQAAFRKHPWVLEAGEVTVTKQGSIRVELVFREPALVVLIGQGSETRAIDRQGVLLPTNAPTVKLPVLLNRLVPQKVSAGQKWPDPDVLRAVEIILLYPGERIERVTEGWHITQPGGKVLRIATP